MSTARHLFVLPFLHLGVGRLAADLMLALRAAGHPVAALTCGWSGDLGDDPALARECRAAGVTVEHADLFSRDAAVMTRTAAAVDAFCDRWRPTVAQAFTAIAAAAVRGCPVVASAVGWSPSKADWQRRMDVDILERCAVVTAVSDAVADELAAAGLRRAPVVVRNGVRVPPIPRTPRPALSTVGAVAHLIPRKGIDVLLEAVALLPAGRCEALRIGGAGEASADLAALAARLPLRCRVDWCGHVALDAFFDSVDVLAVPSRSDALPLVLLEGMAAGLPIVASRTGGIPEALGDDCGCLARPGDAASLARALDATLQHPADAAARAERGHAAVAARFSLGATIARYVACYEEAATAGLVR